ILCMLVTMDIVVQGTFYTMIVSPHSSEYIPLLWDELIWLLAHKDSLLLSGTLFNMTLLMIIVIPLLSAFRVAASLESGLIRTLLTFPIKRRDLLILKGLEILMLVVLPVTAGALIGIVLVDWFAIGLDSFLLLLSFWSMAFTILTSSLLLSVTTGSAAKTAFSGIAIWIVLYFVAALTKIPVLLRGVLNPVNLAISYSKDSPGASFGLPFEGMVFSDVWGSIVINLLIGLFLLLMSIRSFRRVEA
ncbi:MAG: hypothetical protein ACTSPB_14450, partial [Candidatus Thorarchaeota archaeon]